MPRASRYYSDPRIAEVLALEPQVLRQARRELIGLGLIAYQKPLYQLLSLDDELVASPQDRPAPWADHSTQPPPPTPAPRGPSLKAMVERLLQNRGSAP